MKVDALFIHANNAPVVYQDLHKSFSAVEPPLWSLLLAKAMRNIGYEVELMDCEVLRLNTQKAVKIIEEISPKLAVFVVHGQQPSASTQNMTAAVELCDAVKTWCPEIKTMFIGGHPAALPEITMTSHGSIDFCAYNEGYYTLKSLLECNGKYDDVYLKDVSGLVWRASYTNNIIRNNPADLVTEMHMPSKYPGYAWDLIPVKEYRTSLWHSYTNDCDQENFASIYTSLGCPFKCDFCMINILNRTTGLYSNESNIMRTWPVDWVMDQLEYLADHGIKNLKIADEMFVLNPNHFMTILKEIELRDFDFNIWCYARVDTIKEEYLGTMRRAGVRWLGLGIESGAHNVRAQVTKGTFDDERIGLTVSRIRAYDINVAANYIFGLPDDDFETMQKTLDMAISLNTEMANFYCAMAYPGSPLFRSALQKGWPLPDSYSGFSQHSYDCQPLPTKHLSQSDVLQFRDDAWMSYHNRDDYYALLIKKFGYQAAKKTKEMTEIRLKRKILGD